MAVVLMLATITPWIIAPQPALGETDCNSTLAEPVVMFADNFAQEPFKTAVQTLANSNVVANNVDIFGQKETGEVFGDYYPNHGTYLDLSGSPGLATISIKKTFSLKVELLGT